MNWNQGEGGKQMIVELKPKFDGKKSFYNKARLQIESDEITLISYNTPIIKLNKNNIMFLAQYEHLSSTTMRHLREFLRQSDMFNLASMKKNEMYEMLNELRR